MIFNGDDADKTLIEGDEDFCMVKYGGADDSTFTNGQGISLFDLQW